MKQGYWYYIHRYGVKSVFVRCAIIILLVLVFPCALFMDWVHSFYAGYMRKDIANAYQYALGKSREALDIQLSEAVNMSDALIYNTELMAFPGYAKMDRIDYNTLRGTVQIERDLSSALTLQKMIQSIYVYYESVGLVCSTKCGSKPIENFSDLSWKNACDSFDVDRKTHIIYRVDDEGQKTVSLIRKNLSNGNMFCTIINMDMDRLAEYMLNVNEKLEQVYLLDQDGTVLYPETTQYQTIQHETQLIQNTVQLKTAPWSLVSVVSADTVEAQLSSINKWLYRGIGCIILIGVVVAAVISRWLYYALRILPNILMDDFGTDEAYVRKADLGEVNELIRSATAGKNTLPEILRRTQLNALQAQINPHFIYNTLDAISWRTIGYLGDENEVTEMIGKMADLMRMSMSQTSVMTTLRDELHCAELYVEIMQFRFWNRFVFHNEIDDSFLDTALPPFSLQPLIENAILHGGKDAGHPLSIVLTARQQENVLEISVIDDGIGMTREKLDEIYRRLEHESGKGLGLYNVQRRIHILFGEQYGLFIQSEPQKGTQMMIRIPVD
jgi:sensor histidine kinase YesM